MGKFFKQYAAYSLGIAINRLASLLLLPLYTRFLSPSDYGILDILLTITALFQPLVLLGVDTSIQILFFQAETKKKQNELITTSIVTVAFLGGIFTAFIFLIIPEIINIILNSKAYTNIVFILCFYIWLDSLQRLFQNNFRLSQQPLIYNIIAFSKIVLMAAFNILFLAVQKQGVAGIINGLVMADLIVTGISAGWVFKHHLQMPAITHIKPLLNLGLPLIPVSAAYWVLNASDRFFLAKMSNLEEVGLYGIAYRLAAAMGIFTSAIQLGWRPFALRIQTELKARNIYATMPVYYLVGVGWLGLLLVVFSPMLLKIFATTAYEQAAVLLSPLVFAQVSYGLYYIVSTGIEIKQLTYHLTWTIALAAIANTGLNILLIPSFGALGASLATVISYGLAAVLVGIISQHLYPLPYDFSKIVGVCACLIVAYGTITIIFIFDSSYSLIFSLACVLLAGVVLSTFVKREIELLKNKVSHYFNKIKQL